MNIRMIVRILGYVLLGLALSLLLPLGVALLHGEDFRPYAFAIAIILLLGFPASRMRTPDKSFYSRESFFVVSMAWILISLLGALPYWFSGTIPRFIDAFFETVSGFTTTGSTILPDVEDIPYGLLFWRSMTQWLGGMGVLVLALAILPSLGARTSAILRAEAPGPTPTQLAPRVAQTAKILYILYISLTLLNAIALCLAGLPLYDAFIHAFSTAGTGGFSHMNSSIAYYDSLAVEIITTIFMLAFGTSFAVHYMVSRRDWKGIRANEEFRFYLIFALLAMVLVAVNIAPLYGSPGESFRHASFQVASVMTSTAFASTNFNQWPLFSRCFLILLMLIGSCAGSTGGGLKCMRVIILFKAIRQEVLRILHPRLMKPLHYNGHALDENITSGILIYIGLYIAVICAAFLLLSTQGLSFETNLTAAISSISNMGPGFDQAYSSYAMFNSMNKIVLSACMLLGRLEILPFFILLTPGVWRKAG